MSETCITPVFVLTVFAARNYGRLFSHKKGCALHGTRSGTSCTAKSCGAAARNIIRN